MISAHATTRKPKNGICWTIERFSEAAKPKLTPLKSDIRQLAEAEGTPLHLVILGNKSSSDSRIRVILFQSFIFSIMQSFILTKIRTNELRKCEFSLSILQSYEDTNYRSVFTSHIVPSVVMVIAPF